MGGLIGIFAVMAFCWFAAEAALAHAFLESAQPRVGDTVKSSPSQILLTFTEDVEPAFSKVVVRDANGARVDTGQMHPAPDSAKELIVPLKPISPGTYRVEWHVTSIDTHKTEGSYTFTVAP
ncbi:MAG: copper homeostasis periplasmic binding protein CopC [Acetobacteraceae bacterium]|nr:copper homeostasis periplasmic binding protein CopC [Acetobacteraceae bacterium]